MSNSFSNSYTFKENYLTKNWLNYYKNEGFLISFRVPRTLVQISLARTKQPVKPVLPVKDITVCVQWDLKGIIARTVS